jgi:2-polyprenyl-6-methoxyphenol hydroxylase-like FAD-dependent oxidoreductase
LAAFLVDEAARRYPDAITFHFSVKPELNLQQRTVRLMSNDSNQLAGSSRELSYDLLVGADVAASSVRAALEHTVQDISVSPMTVPMTKQLLPVTEALEPQDWEPLCSKLLLARPCMACLPWPTLRPHDS